MKCQLVLLMMITEMTKAQELRPVLMMSMDQLYLEVTAVQELSAVLMSVDHLYLEVIVNVWLKMRV